MQSSRFVSRYSSFDVHDAGDDRPTEAIFVPSCNIIAGAIDIQERRLSRKGRAPEYPGSSVKVSNLSPNKSPHGLRNPPTTIATVDLFGSGFLCCNCENAAKLIVHEIKHSQQLPFLITHINTHSFRTLSSNRKLLEALRMRCWYLLEGIGLKAACVLTRGRVPDDTNGTDLCPRPAQRAA